MKNSIITTILALTLFFVGCSTNNTSNNPVTPTDQALITLAAATGTELAVQNNPSYTPYFLGAEQVLLSISTGTNAISATTVEAALTSGGVTNVAVASAITEAIQLGDSYITSNTSGTNTSLQIVELRIVCGDVGAGIQQGLALAGKVTITTTTTSNK